MGFAGVTPRLVAKVCAAGTGTRKRTRYQRRCELRGKQPAGRFVSGSQALRSGPAPLAFAENVRAGCGTRAQVLRRDTRRRTQLLRRVPGPAGVPEKTARKRDH